MENHKFAKLLFTLVILASNQLVFGQARTAEGDILRGQGRLAEGAGWYNFNTARANKINVEAMRNYNEEVRLNYAYRVKFWAEKREGRKITLEEAKKRAIDRERQLRSNPTADDVKSGDALNVMITDLTDPDIDQDAWSNKSVPLPSSASLKDIVFVHYPNKIAENEKKVLVALSRLGKDVEWPLFFQSPEFETERTEYINSVTKFKAGVLDSKYDSNQKRVLDESLKKLASKIEVALDDKGGFRAEGRRFHKEKLTEAVKLFDGSNIDWSREILYDTEKYDAKNVPQLVAFMRQYRLHFAEADTSRSNKLYGELFAALKKQASELEGGRPRQKPDAGRNAEERKPPMEPLVGGKWSGKGRYTKGVKRADLTDDVWELTIGKRSEGKFEGEISYFGTGVHKRLTFPVAVILPKRGSSEIKIEMQQKRRQYQNFEGHLEEDGTIKAKFTGVGAEGQEVEGDVVLVRQRSRRGEGR